jgi:hypothetical protein
VRAPASIKKPLGHDSAQVSAQPYQAQRATREGGPPRPIAKSRFTRLDTIDEVMEKLIGL